MDPIEEDSGVVVITPQWPEICANPREGLDDIRHAFDEAAVKNPKALVVNLGNVRYVDSIGLGAIITGRMKLPGDCDFRVCSLGGKLDSILRVSGLTKFVRVEESLETALGDLRGKSAE